MNSDLKWHVFPNEKPKYEGYYIVTLKTIDDTLKTSIALWEDDSFRFIIADFCNIGGIVTGFAEFPKPLDCYVDVSYNVETMKKSSNHNQLLKCYKQAKDALWLVYHKRLNELIKDS